MVWFSCGPQYPVENGPETLAALLKRLEVVCLTKGLPVEGIERLALKMAAAVRARKTRHVVHSTHGLASAALAHDALAAFGAKTEVIARFRQWRTATVTSTALLSSNRRCRCRSSAALGARVELLLDWIVKIIGSAGGGILNGLVQGLVCGRATPSSTGRRCLLSLLLQILLQMITFEKGQCSYTKFLNEKNEFITMRLPGGYLVACRNSE